MNPVSIDILPEINFVSAPVFSPDGQKIAFIVQKADLENNNYKGDLYLYNCVTEKILRLTRSGNVKRFIWTKAGAVLFQALHSEKSGGENNNLASAFYEISINGGEAIEKFSLSEQTTSFYECEDGRFVIAAEAENTVPCDKAYEIFDEIPIWANGKGMTNKKRIHFFVYTPNTGKLLRICDEWASCTSYSVRGNRILYKAYPWQDVRGQYDGIYLYDVDTQTNRCLLAHDIRRTGPIAFWDDDQALVAAAENNVFGDEKYPDFYVMNLGDGTMRLLTPYDYSIAAGDVGTDARLGEVHTDKNTEDGYYFITTKGDSSFLHLINRNGSISEALTPPGSCDSFDISSGHIVVCGLYENRLPELYLDGRQITDFNRTERWNISVPETFCFPDKDGFKIQGWVIKPVDYQSGKRYPAILNIHGGPRTVFGSVFHHEMQTWAAAGYFVFYCNPRGSDGGGTAFGSLNGKYGTVDFDNIMAFTDEVLKRYPDIDVSRLGVAGGSYGGYMTNWIICHTDRFRAAVSQRSIASWITFEHMSDIGHTFTQNTQGALTREDAHKLWWHSPLKYAANCKTPTLFVHSSEDYRCPMAEGLQMFSALKILGIESRMCLIKGENHELSRSGRPRSRMLRMTEILNWMDRHLKGAASDIGANSMEGSGQ